MIRKSLFLGLTGTLVAVLAYLVVHARRQEKHEQQSPRPVEIVKDSTPSLTRILAPQDLEVVEVKTDFAGDTTRTATHHLVIRNKGTSAYTAVLIKLSYFGNGERSLETRTRQVNELLQPGQAHALGEIVISDLPAGVLKARAGVLAADLESGPPLPK